MFATVVLKNRNTFVSPFEVVREVLPACFMKTALLLPINASFRQAPNQKRKSPLSLDGLWHYVTSHFAAKVDMKDRGNWDELEMDWKSLFVGKKRNSAIHAAFKDIQICEQIWVDTICANMRSLFSPGSFVTVDETVLAYTGQDMIDRKIQVFIPRKPHPFGALLHGACMVAQHSNLPFFVDWKLRWTGQIGTPTVALSEMTKRLVAWANQKLILLTVIADSGFATARILKDTSDSGAQVLASVSSSPSSGHHLDYQLATRGLLHGQCRTILSNGIVFQARMLDERPTVVATAAYKRFVVPSEGSAASKVWSRDEAHAIASYDRIFSTICPDVQLPNDSLYARMCYLCGEDVAWPPGTRGKTSLLTKENMKKIYAPAIKELYSQLLPDAPSASLSKDSMIDAILNLQSSETTPAKDSIEEETAHEAKSSATQLELQLDRMTGPPTLACPLVDSYCAKFNAEDRANRAYYWNYDGTSHKEVKALLLHSLMFFAFWSAYVAWVELINENPGPYVHLLPHATTAVHLQITFPRFIAMVHEQRHREGSRLKNGAPKKSASSDTSPTPLDVSKIQRIYSTFKLTPPPLSKSPKVRRIIEQHKDALFPVTAPNFSSLGSSTSVTSNVTEVAAQTSRQGSTSRPQNSATFVTPPMLPDVPNRPKRAHTGNDTSTDPPKPKRTTMYKPVQHTSRGRIVRPSFSRDEFLISL